MVEDDFAIIENAQDALHTAAQHDCTIEERISNNYYIEEYLSLDNLPAIRQNSLKEGLRSCRFRSLCWRIFLECLPESSKERIKKIRTLRERYEEIRNKYRQDPRSFHDMDSVTRDNPLSQEETSHWNRYFSDDELQSRIQKDVIRAFPDIVFFQSDKIQSIMVNILFNYARENAHLEYKQGMHEILAPLIFVIHCDHQSYLFAQENGLVEQEIKELLDANYLEHDSYFMFVHVMERIESWYDNNSVKTIKKYEYVNMEPFSNDVDFNCYSKIGVKLKMINEQILRRSDEKLYNHLKELRIPPQIYGIRWMRLLFIREFQMQDLLVLWDAIFADGIGLCDYIFTAMLLVISKILLPCDYTNCLNHLMRYPSVCDVHYVIHLALHIRDPLKYPVPVEHSTLVLPNPNALRVQRENRLHSPLSSSSANHSPTMVKSPTKPVRPKSLLTTGAGSVNNQQQQSSLMKNNEMTNMSFEWIEDKLTKHRTFYYDGSGGGGGSSSREYTENLTRSEEIKLLYDKMDFCAHYMSKNLEIIQAFVNAHQKSQQTVVNNENDTEVENVLLSIAEMKKIRDILRGTIAFENSLN